MDTSLSVDSLDLLRTMVQSEAWKIYEADQQEQIRQLRVLATDQTIMLDSPQKALWFAAMAQGRENSITSLKDLLYGRQTSSNS